MKFRIPALFVVILAAAAAVDCGGTPPSLGVAVSNVMYQRTAAGPAPADVASRQFIGSSLLRVRHADLVGDAQQETIVERPDHHSVEVRDTSGTPVGGAKSLGYLTDFAGIRDGGAGLVILYGYPNDAGGGDFTIVTPDGREVSRWTERIPPGAFTVGPWGGSPAVISSCCPCPRATMNCATWSTRSTTWPTSRTCWP